MKVLCINAKPLSNAFNSINALLKEGNIYTVSEECLGTDIYGNTVPIYCLVGFDSRLYGFCRTRFIPLSDIDETELVNEQFLTKKP